MHPIARLASARPASARGLLRAGHSPPSFTRRWFPPPRDDLEQGAGHQRVTAAALIVVSLALGSQVVAATAAETTADPAPPEWSAVGAEHLVPPDAVIAAAAAREERVTAPEPVHLGQFVVTCYALRGTTSTGDQVHDRGVAVDPRVIPYGTRVYIEGIGWRVANDTGRKIKGNRLDIWNPSHDWCVQFGRRTLGVHR